jgi:hypothetical protein
MKSKAFILTSVLEPALVNQTVEAGKLSGSTGKFSRARRLSDDIGKLFSRVRRPIYYIGKIGKLFFHVKRQKSMCLCAYVVKKVKIKRQKSMCLCAYIVKIYNINLSLI